MLNTIGFLGCGNMGGAVARAVCKGAGSGDVLLANRTPAKAQALADELGCACGTNEEVAGICDFIFLGVKPQMMADMLDELTVLEQVFASMPPEFRQLNEYEAKRMLTQLGRADTDRRSGTLSGGERRRAALCAALIHPADVLVLDEPSAGLDPQGREELLANIREFHRARGTTVVLVSHSMEEIAKNVDRIVALSDSHVLMSGTPREVFARGDELMTAGLDVPQVTRVAMALRDKGIASNPAGYTVDELSKELVALKRGGGKKC